MLSHRLHFHGSHCHKQSQQSADEYSLVVEKNPGKFCHAVSSLDRSPSSYKPGICPAIAEHLRPDLILHKNRIDARSIFPSYLLKYRLRKVASGNENSNENEKAVLPALLSRQMCPYLSLLFYRSGHRS